KHGTDTCGGSVTAQRFSQCWTPLAKGEQTQPNPECARRQQRPLVKPQAAGPTLPPTRRRRCTRGDAAAGEFQIGANVRVARRESFGEAIIENRPADLARFEKSIAEVEVQGRGGLALSEHFFVGRHRFGELALFVKLVGLVECG